MKFNFFWYVEEKLLIFNAHSEPHAYKQKPSYSVQYKNSHKVKSNKVKSITAKTDCWWTELEAEGKEVAVLH